jgi:uncharacterized integral membrane protein
MQQNNPEGEAQNIMNKRTFDDHMSAAAFAEAGEFDTARQMLESGGGKAPERVTNRKPFGKTLVFGAISLTAYLVIFTHQELVTGSFTLGGWYTVLPVGTALFFSFIHGAFASNLLSVLNLEARK